VLNKREESAGRGKRAFLLSCFFRTEKPPPPSLAHPSPALQKRNFLSC
jgi:hypothetical protein